MVQHIRCRVTFSNRDGKEDFPSRKGFVDRYGYIEPVIPKVQDKQSHAMLQDAVERNIEIIGEAVNKLLKIEPEIEITNARRIVDARNKIIHGYDEIENAQIWAIIINHLPLLKIEANQYLEQ